MKTKLIIASVLLMMVVPIGYTTHPWALTPSSSIGENKFIQSIDPSHRYSTLSTHPAHPNELFIASDDEILQKMENGDLKKIWQAPSTVPKINRLVAFAEWPNQIFALTKKGVFRVHLLSGQAEQIFEGPSKSGNSVLSMTLISGDPHHWLLGTEGGLFESDDAGKTWHRFDFFKKSPIGILLFSQEHLYIANDRSLYVSDNLLHFQKRLSQKPSWFETSSETLEDTAALSSSISEDESIALSSSFFHDLIHFKDSLWLASSKGIYQSLDRGRSWKLLPESGLMEIDIKNLRYSSSQQTLYASTEKDLYRYEPSRQRWQRLPLHSSTQDIQALEILRLENRESLFVLTERTILEHPITPTEIFFPHQWIPSPDRALLFRQLIRLEPTAREVHESVIRYANVSNSKIKRWQWTSKLRALIPHFSFGKDFSTSNNIDLDRGSTNDADMYIFGPDNISHGWDWDISWELEDLIWNTAQTSIDSREKMMVELRHDFLSEATRIYYERRHLQTEIVFSPSPAELEHLSRLIRLDELTALLDGMTNGKFGEKVREVYKENPELEQLWEYREKTLNLTQNNAKNEQAPL